MKIYDIKPRQIETIKKPHTQKARSGFLRWHFSASAVFLGLFLSVALFPVIFAFEAHVINVTATIEGRDRGDDCQSFEVRSHGYWKNHEEDWILPQTIGPDTIDEVSEVELILQPDMNTWYAKVARELLAMKFNIAHFGAGDALVPGEGITLNQLAAEADALLIQKLNDPDSVTDQEMEDMKDRLEKVNVAENVSSCPPEFHFIKIECPEYSDLTGNRDADNLDHTEGNYTQFTNYPDFPNPYPLKPIDPSEIPPQCIKIPGWDFKLSSDEAQNNDVMIAGQTDGDGEFKLPFTSLSTPLQTLLLGGDRIWVSEVEQPEVAAFGALRCYNDAINGDNLEFIRFDEGELPDHVYCIAYNVKLHSDNEIQAFESTSQGEVEAASVDENFSEPVPEPVPEVVEENPPAQPETEVTQPTPEPEEATATEDPPAEEALVVQTPQEEPASE